MLYRTPKNRANQSPTFAILSKKNKKKLYLLFFFLLPFLLFFALFFSLNHTLTISLSPSSSFIDFTPVDFIHCKRCRPYHTCTVCRYRDTPPTITPVFDNMTFLSDLNVPRDLLARGTHLLFKAGIFMTDRLLETIRRRSDEGNLCCGGN